MTAPPWLLLLLGALACTGAPPRGKGPAAGTDTAPDTDGDSGPDSGGADDTGAPASVTLRGRVDASRLPALPPGLRVSAIPVEFGRGPALHTPTTSAAVDAEGRFALDLPATPPLADQYQVGEFQPLDVSGATLILLVHEGDDDFVDGDEILGIAMDGLAVWLDGTAPDHGWPAGWSIADSGMAGTYGDGRCLTDTGLPLQWRGEEPWPVFTDLAAGEVVVALPGAAAPFRLDATVAPLPAGTDRLVALSYAVAFQGEDGPGPTWDTALAAGPLSWTPTETPPPEADLTQSPYWRYALYVPLSYADADADGAWSAGDSPDGGALCSGAERVLLRYSRPLTTWQGYRLMDCQGGTVGWRAVTRTDAGTWSGYLDAAAAGSLVLDEAACSW